MCKIFCGAVTAKFNKLDFFIQIFFRGQHTVQSLIYGKYSQCLQVTHNNRLKVYGWMDMGTCCVTE